MSIHQLKVTLTGIAPPIWRRVDVRSDATLAELHRVLQDAMGWEDDHLHAFEVGDGRYGGSKGRDEYAATLGDVLPTQGGRMIYTYDFGDNWHHTIDVEKIHRPQPGATYPRPMHIPLRLRWSATSCPRRIANCRRSSARPRER